MTSTSLRASPVSTIRTRPSTGEVITPGKAVIRVSPVSRIPLEVRRPRVTAPERVWLHGTDAQARATQAKALAAKQGLTVKRVDLGRIVSKYLGETEKNLARLFDRAEDKGWVLYFDEADALFGKRTNVRDAHDRYANQAVNYLLQRIRKSQRSVVFGSARKTNLDSAFLRRLRLMLAFSPVPPKP